MLIKKQFIKLSIVLLIIQVIFISGCASNKYREGLNASGGYHVTDRDILEFNNHVRHMMRLKMKYATIAAYVSSTVAIGTATAATILSAGGAGVITVASLAGTSAFSSDIMGIFSFSETTVAYQDGVELMERAEARYFQALARRSTDGLIHADTLTIEAANLYSETVGALALVEKALASRIPTMTDIRQAMGQAIDDTESIRTGNSVALSHISVTPSKVMLKEENLATKPFKIITFKGNVPAKNVLSLDESIVKVTEIKPLSAKLTGQIGGKTKIIVLADTGESTGVQVEVSSPISIKSNNEEIAKDTFKQNQTKTYKITSISKIEAATLVPAKCTISAANQANPINTLSDLNNKTEGEFIVSNCQEDTYILTITNDFKTIKLLTIDVVK